MEEMENPPRSKSRRPKITGGATATAGGCQLPKGSVLAVAEYPATPSIPICPPSHPLIPFPSSSLAARGGGVWTNASESPISAYIRHLQNSSLRWGRAGWPLHHLLWSASSTSFLGVGIGRTNIGQVIIRICPKFHQTKLA